MANNGAQLPYTEEISVIFYIGLILIVCVFLETLISTATDNNGTSNKINYPFTLLGT